MGYGAVLFHRHSAHKQHRQDRSLLLALVGRMIMVIQDLLVSEP